MQHGLSNSADNWFLNGEDGSQGFHLVNRGFDVWAGNNRGNKYSKEHTNPDINKKDFFAYSFHELAWYDVPAHYKTILSNYSDNTKIVYIGHSQGTSQIFASMSKHSPNREY